MSGTKSSEERSTIGNKHAPPLGGVRVLDLTRAAAGPFCTMILGDFGADVIKVEGAPNGDLLRAFGPFDHGEGTYFLSINRNKRSILVDFRSPDGLTLLREMAAKVDVLVENFRPGVAAEMGLGFEELRADNPGLIYASISGFGSSGPYGDWPGVDQIAQGMSGLMSVTGTEDSGPLRVGVPIGDLTAGMWTALGIMGAVAHKQRTGMGQRVETSLIGALIALLCVQGQRYLSLNDVAGPVGNDHPVISPYGLVVASDGPLNICVATEQMWKSFCRIIDRDHFLQDSRFYNNAERAKNRTALTNEINEALSSDTGANWAMKFVAAGIPAGPIYRTDQMFNDKHVQQSGLVKDVQHPTIGNLKLVGCPILSDFTDQQELRPPPLPGEHSREIMEEFGVSEERIDAALARLAQKGDSNVRK